LTLGGASGGGGAGRYTARGGLIISSRDFNPERMHLDDEVLRALSTPFPPMPPADVGDTISDVQAVVDYSFGNFKYFLTGTTEVRSGGLRREVTQSPDKRELAVASMNVENLAAVDPNLTPTELEEKFQQTRHDMTAFLYSVTSGLGPEGRWVHLGMTSNDVWDTATALQLRDSAAILLAGVDALIEALAAQAPTIIARMRQPWRSSGVWRITAAISSTVGGSAG
jgi:hypothetical protein